MQLQNSSHHPIKKNEEIFGKLNFLSKSIYKCNYISDHSTTFLEHKKKFEWNLEHQKRFGEIKTFLTEQSSNTIPDSNQPFYAMWDASNFGIGTALLQPHQGNVQREFTAEGTEIWS